MSDAYLYADFPAGVITGRIVTALSVLSTSKLHELMIDGKICATPKDKDALPNGLTHYNLSWNELDCYASACDLSLRYFLYGGELPAKTAYSYFDPLVLPVLRLLSADIIAAAADVLRATYNNPRFSISRESTPSAKLVELLLFGGKLPKLVPEEELDLYSFDINQEIYRFRSLRIKERTVFHIDNILDMCTYCKVSPHWVFSLYGELLCDTPEADDFFDVFCLLPRTQQVAALSMLLNICQYEQIPLPEELKTDIQNVIAVEGGWV